MEPHHKAWLSRTKVDPSFLSEALRNGFDVHHLDGDHQNNDPENLMLIYTDDHFLLHNAKKFTGRSGGVWMTQEELDNAKMTKGQRAYEDRQGGKVWKEIDIPNALGSAKFYAQRNDKPWPVIPSKEGAEILKRRRESKARETSANRNSPRCRYGPY